MALPAPLDKLQNFFSRYTFQQKLTLAGVGASVMVMLWLLVYFTNQVDYLVLYAELDAQEAQTIVQRLRDQQVPFELSEDGRTIKVPSDRLSELRIQLATDGLPESGRIGFEIFDRTNFGLTNFQEQVNYQRALEGELARSVVTLSEVETARVHLVLPRDSLFQNNNDQAKASVILKLKRGRDLSVSAVQGITHIVANSVKGLTAERVTIIDYRGQLLSKADSENPMTAQQLDTRHKMETELAEKITGILEPVVGIGKVRPRVSVTMNWQQVEETVEQFDPQSATVRSQQTQQERNGAGAPLVGGVPGPKSEPATTPAAPDPGLVRQSATVNYEISKSVRHIVNPVGKIERMSVAVIIDNRTSVTTNSEGKTERTSEPWKPEEIKKYRDLVTATVGIDTDRGDQLILENVSFESETQSLEEPAFLERNGPMMITGIRYLIIPIAFVLVYLLFLRPVQKTLFASASVEPRAALPAAAPGAGMMAASIAQGPMTLRQLEAQLKSGESAAIQVPPIDHAAEREFLPLPSPSRSDVIRNRVMEHAKQEPETVARLIRVWLQDEKKK